MLDYLGVPYVQSPGEAEATCAALNASGVMPWTHVYVGIALCSSWFLNIFNDQIYVKWNY